MTLFTCGSCANTFDAGQVAGARVCPFCRSSAVSPVTNAPAALVANGTGGADSSDGLSHPAWEGLPWLGGEPSVGDVPPVGAAASQTEPLIAGLACEAPPEDGAYSDFALNPIPERRSRAAWLGALAFSASLMAHCAACVALALFITAADEKSVVVLLAAPVTELDEPALVDVAPPESQPEPPTQVFEVVDTPEESFWEPAGAAPTAAPEMDTAVSAPIGLGGPGLGALGRAAGRGGRRSDLPSGSLGDLLHRARSDGLEVVIAFDSTGSMNGELEAVKKNIGVIGGALLRKVPNARISLVSYKDIGDGERAVQGVSLTNNIPQLEQFLGSIRADGGGDEPEAVEAGLGWALEKNAFRRSAVKVILIFGDAPPHAEKLDACQTLAGRFHREQQGVVTTISCRQAERLPEFYEIAKAGGGEAFTNDQPELLMQQLLVLIFGNQHREDVLKFFGIAARPARASPPSLSTRR